MYHPIMPHAFMSSRSISLLLLLPAAAAAAVAAANGEKCALILPRAVCPLVLLRALISHAPCCMPHAPRV